MRFASAVLTASVVCGLSLAAQSPAQRPEMRELTDAFPGNPKVDQFALSADGQRTYFVNSAGEAWLFDRTRKTSARLTAGPLWDLNVSPAGDALAYTKGGDRRGDQFVWVLPLDPATGAASGAERKLSAQQASLPSISPDGKLIAFVRDDATGVGQSVVVAPTAGGTERVVAAAIPSSLANIRWTPDGKTLYLGVNPPVACVPEWSCLPLKADLRQPPGTIRRVAIAGGEVTTIATARGLSPGLSPDGTTLMYQDPSATGSTRRWVVANADGSKRDTVTLPPTQSPAGWLQGSTVVLSSSGNLRRLRTMSLADGQSRVVEDGADVLLDPSWSPDGTRMATMARVPPHAELRIRNSDGSPQRTWPLSEIFASSTAWSPDQRWIAYIGSSDGPTAHVGVVEVATGQTRQLYEFTPNQSIALRWLADSRRLVLTETSGRPDSDTRRVSFRTVDLDGQGTLLKEYPLGPAPSTGIAIDDTTAVVMSNVQTGYHLVRLSGAGAERDVLSSRPSDPPALLSSDGQWLIQRRNPSPGESAPGTVLELVRVDGSARKSIPLPFVAAGGNNPRMLRGGNDLVVVEARRPDGESGVYLVSASTQIARKLFTYSSQFAPPELAVSADGRQLVYLLWESVPPAVLTMDLSAPRVR
jgi:Tol biopolymer transport system component